mmetsp:Transcript_16601/g.29881  ORF Transcript_16601/g.29881 Transcript_16601/m.29881 type:complete len:419 (-) Transcript_16601:5118-6374(-)
MERIAWDLQTSCLTAFGKPRHPVVSKLSVECKEEDLQTCYNLLNSIYQKYAKDYATRQKPVPKPPETRPRIPKPSEPATVHAGEDAKKKPRRYSIEEDLARMGRELPKRRKSDEDAKVDEESYKRTSSHGGQSKPHFPATRGSDHQFAYPPPEFYGGYMPDTSYTEPYTYDSFSYKKGPCFNRETQVELSYRVASTQTSRDWDSDNPSRGHASGYSSSGEPSRRHSDDRNRRREPDPQLLPDSHRDMRPPEYNPRVRDYRNDGKSSQDERRRDIRNSYDDRRRDTRSSNDERTNVRRVSQDDRRNVSSSQLSRNSYDGTSRSRNRTPNRAPESPRSPPVIQITFQQVEPLLRRLCNERGFRYSMTEEFSRGIYFIRVIINGYSVAEEADSNPALAKFKACMTGLRCIDEELTSRLDVI